MAFLVLLEALSPVERAVFMLREVFGYGYPDVARITGKTEVNCRQIFARARQRRREEGEELARRSFEAAAGGDMDALLGMLAPDVVLHGGRQGAGDREAAGRAAARHAAARRPAPPGPDPRRLPRAGLGQRPAGRRDVRHRRARGRRGRARRRRGVVQAIRSVVNPDKLGHIGPVSDVARLPNTAESNTAGYR